MEYMVNFEKDSLLKSQIFAYHYAYRDMLASIVIVNIAMLIACVVMMFFFNVYIALLIESLVVAFSAYFYFSMNVKYSKVLRGEYQKLEKISLSINKENILIKLLKKSGQLKEENRENITIYSVEKNDIDYVKVFPKIVVIKLKNDGKIKLPNTKECIMIFENSFVKSLKNYKVYN